MKVDVSVLEKLKWRKKPIIQVVKNVEFTPRDIFKVDNETLEEDISRLFQTIHYEGLVIELSYRQSLSQLIQLFGNSLKNGKLSWAEPAMVKKKLMNHRRPLYKDLSEMHSFTKRVMLKIASENAIIVSEENRKSDGVYILYPPIADSILPESITQHPRYHAPYFKSAFCTILIIFAIVGIGTFTSVFIEKMFEQNFFSDLKYRNAQNKNSVLYELKIFKDGSAIDLLDFGQMKEKIIKKVPYR